MKKYSVLFSILAFLGLQSSKAQEKFLAGWEGKLEQAGLTLVFHFEKDATGAFLAKMDSPDQGAYGIKMDQVTLTENTVFTELKQYGLSYKGTLINDSTIDGSLTQGATFPFKLTRVRSGSVTLKEKPQTPVAPFPYETEEVTFNSISPNVTLSGTITKPSGNTSTYPAIILISGSGPQNRDEQIGNHKPFAVIADYFTRNGYLVLRFDDRGVGKSTGVFSNATSADFAKDVEGAVQFLLNRNDVNTKQLGLIGHSEGGMIAPMVAAARKDIAFLILLAGPGIPVQEMMAEQNTALFRNAGVDSVQANLYGNMYRQITHTILHTNEPAQLQPQLVALIQKHVSGMDKRFVSLLNLHTPDNVNAYAKNMAEEMNEPWMRYFLQYDPQPVLKKVRAHILALNGEKDIQVLATSNINGIETSLKKGVAHSYQTVILPGLNHLFQHCTSCNVQEYMQLEETFSDKALKEMHQWLKSVLKP